MLPTAYDTEKSETPIGTRSMPRLMPPLLCGAKRSSMSSSYSADDESTYAAASVMAAPKPTMAWNVVSGLTRMLGEDGAAPSGMSGSSSKRWLWSAVVR